MNQRTHTDALRDATDDLADELEHLADALDAGDATADDVRDVHVEIATTMVDLEDEASRPTCSTTSRREHARSTKPGRRSTI